MNSSSSSGATVLTAEYIVYTYSSRFTYPIRIYSAEISILTKKCSIILLYNVHTTDHMILANTTECTAVVLVPGTYVRTCISSR